MNPITQLNINEKIDKEQNIEASKKLNIII